MSIPRPNCPFDVKFCYCPLEVRFLYPCERTYYCKVEVPVGTEYVQVTVEVYDPPQWICRCIAPIKLKIVDEDCNLVYEKEIEKGYLGTYEKLDLVIRLKEPNKPGIERYFFYTEATCWETTEWVTDRSGWYVLEIHKVKTETTEKEEKVTVGQLLKNPLIIICVLLFILLLSKGRKCRD